MLVEMKTTIAESSTVCMSSIVQSSNGESQDVLTEDNQLHEEVKAWMPIT